MKTITVTIDQDDIDQAREEDYIVKENIVFHTSTNYDDSLIDEHRGLVILSEETLYQEGQAIWETAIDGVRVVAEYDRPSLDRFIESELQWVETRHENATRVEQREWLDGIALTLKNLEGW